MWLRWGTRFGSRFGLSWGRGLGHGLSGAWGILEGFPRNISGGKANTLVLRIPSRGWGVGRMGSLRGINVGGRGKALKNLGWRQWWLEL